MHDETTTTDSNSTADATNRSTNADDSTGEGPGRPSPGSSSGRSRRRFLKATAGASAIALGSGYAFAHDNVDEETCTSGETVEVGGGDFLAINNMWGTETVDMCTRRYADGHYGWEWSRGSTGAGDPNYPEVMVGTKPWGTTTDAGLFPVQFGDVEVMDVALDVDVSTSGENYNLALEWWHTSERPGSDVGESITHEIMLVLEWGAEHQHGNMIEADAFTDGYGNAIDYWTHYDHDWSFHIFRVAANEAPSNVDLASLVEYLGSEVTDEVASLSPDRWVTGIEIGNEYWDDTAGETTFSQFDATLNGQTATSGSGAGTGGTSGGTSGSGGGTGGTGETGGSSGSTTGDWWGSGGSSGTSGGSGSSGGWWGTDSSGGGSGGWW